MWEFSRHHGHSCIPENTRSRTIRSYPFLLLPHSRLAVLHQSVSYRGFICRAFAIARPVNFDPQLSCPRQGGIGVCLR